MHVNKNSKYFFVFLALYFLLSVDLEAQAGMADTGNAKQVARGKLVYKRFCSLCHGAKLEGQPNWRIRNRDGKLPAPPHDASGHTWHHDDELIFNMTKFGLVPPFAPKDYKTDMPAWGDTLSDADIWAVITFIKSTWPEEIRKSREEMGLRSLK